MTERAVRADSCCGGEVADTGFDDRVALGDRRRSLVRRVLLGASTLFGGAALVLTVLGSTPVLAERLAWAASIWAAGLVFGWARQMITRQRLDWRLTVFVAAVVAGVMWQPLIAAAVAVVLLAEQVLRGPRSETSAAGAVSARLARQPG